MSSKTASEDILVKAVRRVSKEVKGLAAKAPKKADGLKTANAKHPNKTLKSKGRA